jgi:glycyl-tRNA synthetase beta chain
MPETLLWEVGFEELPAWACDQIVEQLPGLLHQRLVDERLDPEGQPTIQVGPRRAAVEVKVSQQQRAERIERRGPPHDAAFDENGVASKACEGFARSAGLTPEQLEVREDNGKKFVWAIADAPVKSIDAVFPDIARDVLSRLNFGKAMRWGEGDDRFVRPLRWVVTKVGGETLSYDVMGVRSGDSSRTHRFIAPTPTVTIDNADSYVSALEAGKVIVSQGERRARIEKGLDAAADSFGGEWFDPAGVLREVVHLVEWPSVLTGRFDEEYLNLPERVLVTAMQSHQRYIPIRKGDTLAPAFLTVMNGDPAATETIVQGYERVLVGRLDDAVFSFNRDRERGIDEMATSLGNVVFHAKAGSLADRTERIRAIAGHIAEKQGMDAADTKRFDDAARLSKADQISVLVQEFAELEGFAGRLYAADAGYDEIVCRAIDQQFLPKGPSSPLPDKGLPAFLALADKVDLLVTAFAIGEQPTGSRDPHGLRRAALGIMRLAFGYNIRFGVNIFFEFAAEQVAKQGFADVSDELIAELHSFMGDRVEKYLTDDGIRVQAVRAARAASLKTLQQLDALARALNAKMEDTDERFLSVVTALGRCAKIVEKAEKDDVAIATDIDTVKFESTAEASLNDALTELAEPLAAAVAEDRFDDAIERAASLSLGVETFFDKDTGVMVMADDAAIRANRLALVRKVSTTLAPLGDLTQLQL